MPDETRVEIEGVEETCSNLDHIGTIAGTAGITAGLNAAGRVIEEFIAGGIETKLEQHTGDLMNDLDMVVQVDERGRGGIVDVGFSSKQGHVARFVEYGHRMIGHAPDYKRLGENVPEKPFMRPAGDAAADPATEAFAEAFNEVIAAASGEED